MPFSYLSDRFGENVSLALAYFSLAVSRFMFLFSRSFVGFSIAYAVDGLYMASAGPAWDSLISKAVPEEHRGIAFGLTTTSRGLLALPLPWIGGMLWYRLSPAVPISITAVGFIFMGYFAWKKYRVPKVAS